MSKFKVGDRVQANQSTGVSTVEEGIELIVSKVDGTSLKFEGIDNSYGFVDSWFDLIESNSNDQEQTDKKFKAGDTVRLIKKDHYFGTQYQVGTRMVVDKVFYNVIAGRINGREARLWSYNCVADNLSRFDEPITITDNNVFEMIAQAKEKLSYRDAYEFQEPAIYKQWKHYYGNTVLRPGGVYHVGADLGTEPIKKTNLINKTMNAFKNAMLPADTKTLIKAGFLYSDSLDLTNKGKEALNFILFEANKKALVAAAEATIAEEKEAAK